jgi:hypothetical protein
MTAMRSRLRNIAANRRSRTSSSNCIPKARSEKLMDVAGGVSLSLAVKTGEQFSHGPASAVSQAASHRGHLKSRRGMKPVTRCVVYSAGSYPLGNPEKSRTVMQRTQTYIGMLLCVVRWAKLRPLLRPLPDPAHCRLTGCTNAALVTTSCWAPFACRRLS